MQVDQLTLKCVALPATKIGRQPKIVRKLDDLGHQKTSKNIAHICQHLHTDEFEIMYDYNFNCRNRIGLFKVTDRYVHETNGNISETVQDL